MPIPTIGADLALNRRLLHDETGMKTIGQITEIDVLPNDLATLVIG